MPRLTGEVVLPSDVLIIPVAQFRRADRELTGAVDGDFAITRPRGRAASSIIDADSAALLERFRVPRTVADAVIDFARARGAEPRAVLDGAMPVLIRLAGAGLLLETTDLRADAIVAMYEVGDELAGFRIVRGMRLREDVEHYLARSPDGAHAVLKLGRPAVVARMRVSIAREAALLRQAAGAPVPAILALTEHDGLPVLATRFIPGVPPVEAARQHREAGRAGRELLLALLVRIAEAYALLHERGLIHADVNAQNLLVGHDDAVTLLDFGLAVVVGDEADAPARPGTHGFKDPELALALRDGLGSPPATFASDQHAVGALLYWVATGATYLEFAGRRIAALEQVIGAPPRSFVEAGASAWPALEAVLGRMLSKVSADRFPSMRAVVEALAMVTHRDADADADTDADADAVPASVGVTTSIRSTSPADELFAALELGGPYHSRGLAIGPRCSINNGAAGIAYAWYRRALVTGTALDLDTAAGWVRRAHQWNDDALAWDDEVHGFDPRGVGPNALFHSIVGVHWVESLVRHAGGDRERAHAAAQAMIKAAAGRSPYDDVTIGRAGHLLGYAELLEASPVQDPPVRAAGDRLAKALETRLAGRGKSASATLAHANAFAHGKAGVAYALLRWSAATGRPVSDRVVGVVDRLAAAAYPLGRGAAIPKYTTGPAADLAPSWCNGEAGFLLLFLLAAERLGEARHLELAERLAWSVWDRSADALYDLCCGKSGRAYALLAFHRVSGDVGWLRRSELLAQRASQVAAWYAPQAHRLFKGALGVALLLRDIETPLRARMPTIEREGWQWIRSRA